MACEFCSLCYQPADLGVGNLLSNGLFGDGLAAAVMRGKGGTGVALERNGSYLVPETVDWIAYDVRSTGFHFKLDKRVPGTMEPLAPALKELAGRHGWDASDLDFYIIHAGGPRILDDLSKFLGVPPEAFRFSRATLTEYGNIASAVVLDDAAAALRRGRRAGLRTRAARRLRAGHHRGDVARPVDHVGGGHRADGGSRAGRARTGRPLGGGHGGPDRGLAADGGIASCGMRRRRRPPRCCRPYGTGPHWTCTGSSSTPCWTG